MSATAEDVTSDDTDDADELVEATQEEVEQAIQELEDSGALDDKINPSDR